jgi:hypothetical protein
MREVQQAPEEEVPERAPRSREVERTGPAVSNAAIAATLDGPGLGGDPPPGGTPPPATPALPTARSPIRSAPGAEPGPLPEPFGDLPVHAETAAAIGALGPIPAPRRRIPPHAALRDVHGWCRALGRLPSEALRAASAPDPRVIDPRGDVAATALRRLALAHAALDALDDTALCVAWRYAALGIDVVAGPDALRAAWPLGTPPPGDAAHRLRRVQHATWHGWRLRLAEVDPSLALPGEAPDDVAVLIDPLGSMGAWPGEGPLAAPLWRATCDPDAAPACQDMAATAGDGLAWTAAGLLRGALPIDLVAGAWQLGSDAALHLLARIGVD